VSEQTAGRANWVRIQKSILLPLIGIVGLGLLSAILSEKYPFLAGAIIGVVGSLLASLIYQVIEGYVNPKPARDGVLPDRSGCFDCARV
jgi:hypothetical protein